MTLKEVLDKTVLFFKEKNIDTPRLDAEILFSEALQYKSRVDLYMKFDQPLKDDELTKCREYVKRRAQGEPVAYILGKKDFYRHTFLVSPAVLIPRPETELLVEAAIEWIKSRNLMAPKILDLGTGSGCIGLSILKEIPGAILVAVDKSADSADVAQLNAERLQVNDRAEILAQDVLASEFAENSFDVILANPPYIAQNDPEVEKDVKIFEPSSALFSADDGLSDLKQWSTKAQRWLKPVGFMGFEMGYTQSQVMRDHFQAMNTFSEVKIIKDMSGHNRHIIGVRHG